MLIAEINLGIQFFVTRDFHKMCFIIVVYIYGY